MKKSPPRKRTSVLEIRNPTPQATDLAAVRDKIRNRVGQEAMNMVEATIDAVKNGQYAALKYLFEAVSLFPADIPDVSREQDGLAPTLLRALGLPEKEQPVTKDSAQS